MTEQILKSDKLAALQLQKTQLRPRIKRWNDERIRLARILSPQYLDITVSRVDDVAKETASKAGATAATGEDATETARRAEALQRTLAGQQVANGESVEIQLRNANLQLQALEDAMEFLDKEIRVEKKLLAIAYSKTMKPKHDDIMRRLCASLLNTHAIWTELFSLKRNLIEAEVGLIGLCLIEPSFLGVPVDPYSDCADFFRAAKKDGFVDAVPKALVLPR